MDNQVSIMEIKTMADMFFESKMFSDINQAAQAFVKIQAGAEMGITPFASMSGIHIIKGKPTIGAGLIASKLKGSGKYDYRIIEQSDKACSIDFYQGEIKIGNSTFTIEDAKKAGTQNLDKFPKNMLFARAISNGVKWYTPDIFSSTVYVHGEINNNTTTTEDGTYEEVKEVQEVDYAEQLKSCGSLEEMKEVWQSIPVSTRTKYTELKDEIKQVLMTFETTTDEQLN